MKCGKLLALILAGVMALGLLSACGGADTDADDLTAEEQAELLGVKIVQKTAKEFYYRRYSGFNTLVIRL